MTLLLVDEWLEIRHLEMFHHQWEWFQKFQ
jgi:hypothetical protein